MTQTTHPDPIGESGQGLLRALAVLATIGEATLRWSAARARRREAEGEAQARRERAATVAERRADAVREAEFRAARTQIERETGPWLERANLHDAARIWRAAATRAADDPRAAHMLGMAQDRVRRLHPPLMEAYDQLRARGVPAREAMRVAARRVWESEATGFRPPPSDARPHGNLRDLPRLGRVGPGELPAGDGDAFDRAVRAEASNLARTVEEAALGRAQRILRNGGRMPPADPVALLEAYALAAIDENAMSPAAAGELVDRARRGRQRPETPAEPPTPAAPASPDESPVVERDTSAWPPTRRRPSGNRFEGALSGALARVGKVQRRLLGRAFPTPPAPPRPSTLVGRTPAATVPERPRRRRLP